MGRKSSLTDKQWAEIEKKLIAGESGRQLAKVYGISEAAIRKRFGSHVKQIKDVANQLVAAEAAFDSLPISAQISARTLANELREISLHLAGAARYGSATAHRLSGIAHGKVQEIDDSKPLDEASLESLKGIAVLTRMANDSSQIGLNLLAANKEAIKEMNKKETPQPSRVAVTVEDASIPDA